MRKRIVAAIVTLALMMAIIPSTAFAVEILPNDGEKSTQEAEMETEKEKPEEPLAKPDPNQVKISSSEAHYVQNGERQDSGTVKPEWNGSAYSKYGCSTADINYTNTLDSNIDVKLSVAIFDGDLLEYFGTTFRTEKEINDLALKGFEALKSGITVSNAAKLADYFGKRTPEEISKLGKFRLSMILGGKKFAGMSRWDLFFLTEEKVKQLSEKDKLTLAQLGGYGFYTRYAKIGETEGVIEPGYAIYKVDLNQLIGDGFYEVEDSAGNITEVPYGLRGGNITLPRRFKVLEDGTKETISYNAIYILNAFDKEKNEFSKVFIRLPIDLYIEEDLPEELQKEYGVTLAELVTESSNQ